MKTIFNVNYFKPTDFDLVLSQYNRHEIKRNNFLIDYDTTANYYYFLESGFARSYVIDLDGADLTTKFFSSSDISINWQSYFLKTKSREHFQAVSNCVV